MMKMKRLKTQKIKSHYIFTIITFAFLITLNIWHYREATEELSKNIYHEFNIYNKMIDSGLVRNLKKVISGEESYAFDTNLIFTVKPMELINNQSEHARISPYSIEINNLKNSISIDIISLKEYFQNTLPPYFNYKMRLVESVIMPNDFTNSPYKTSFGYNLGNNLSLNITFEIDQAFYSEKLQEVRGEQFYFSLFSILFYLISMVIYFNVLKSLEAMINKLKEEALEQKNNNDNYKIRIKTGENMNVDFINKATEIYLNEIEGGDDINYQLFPLLLIDKAKNDINLLEFKTTLNNYLGSLYKNIKIDVKTYCDIASYPMGREVFYQLLISIVDNIISVIQDQTDNERTIKVIINESAIKFEFVSFPLSISKIEHLSKVVYKNNPKIFILDFAKVINSLDQHHVGYNFKTEKNINIFEIQFTENKKQENILKFSTAKK